MSMTRAAKRPYWGIQHPAVGAVACSYCGQPKGGPCRTAENARISCTPYTRTHVVRVRSYHALQALNAATKENRRVHHHRP